MKVLVKFLYSGKVQLQNVSFAFQVLAAAEKLLLVSLKVLCENFIREKMTKNDAFLVLEIARRHNSLSVSKAAIDLLANLSASVIGTLPHF